MATAAAVRAGEAYRVNWVSGLPYPVRNVVRRWRGMLGMMLGVGIALGIGMTLLAVSKASIDLFTGDYRVSGGDLYVITEGGKPVPVVAGDAPGTIDRARNALARIRALPGVRAAVGLMSWSLERERPGPRRRDAPVELFTTQGVDGDPLLIPNMVLMAEGRWVRRADEVVLGSKLARDKGLGLGDSVRLNGRDFAVVGIGRLRGVGGFSADSLAYIEYRALRQRAPVGDVVNTVVVDTTDIDATVRGVEEMDSLSAYDVPQLIALAEEANRAGVVLRWIFMGLTLTIAALFVSSMLARSVAERRMEFATLRAIGVPSRTILVAVATEAVLISGAAFFVGIAISLFFGWAINATVARQYGIESLYSADASLFGLVLLMALGLGLVAGLLPARQATRVDPVEVLREG